MEFNMLDVTISYDLLKGFIGGIIFCWLWSMIHESEG
jgi:hypothetical protein